MYSDTDLDGAVAAGVLTPDAAAAFRRYLSGTGAETRVDEEQFRLLTGFNDIFVAIATVLLLAALAWIGAGIVLDTARTDMPGPFGPYTQVRTLAPLGALFVAAASWGLAEYFTRARRMALPSILLLLAFVGSVAKLVADLVGWVLPAADPHAQGVVVAAAGIAAAGAAWGHWRRFHVPITIAAIAAGGCGVAMGLALAIVPALERYLAVVALVAGLAVFALAMRWDMSDPLRATRRSDVAFWLHLLAAPLIVHPVFKLLGLLDGDATVAEATAVIVLYVVLGMVALAVDRRALMVSALFYVLYALAALFRQFGAVDLSVALTGLVIGSALLLLSAFWHGARGVIVRRLSPSLRARLPATMSPVRTVTAD